MNRIGGALAALFLFCGAASAQGTFGGGSGGGGGGGGCTPSGSSGSILTDSGSGACNSDANATLSAGALSLGASGTPGSVKMGNATTGTITLQPQTGALGTVTVSIPAATDTLANLAGAQTFTNKSIAASEVNSGTFATARYAANILKTSISFIIDGGGSAISTGVVGDLLVPYACTISSASLLADQSGSIVVDVWKKAFATSSPPTVANTITASALPTLSSAQSEQDTTLTGWTTAVSANDMLRFNVNSAATVTRVTLAMECDKT